MKWCYKTFHFSFLFLETYSAIQSFVSRTSSHQFNDSGSFGAPTWTTGSQRDGQFEEICSKVLRESTHG